MQTTRICIVSAIFLTIASCGEAPDPPESAQATSEAPSTAAAPLPPELVVSGQEIVLLGGVFRLRMPENWQQESAPDAPTYFEIAADRYATDLDRWARCIVIKQSVINLVGATQDLTNGRLDSYGRDDVADLQDKGISAQVTMIDLKGNLRARRIAYADEGIYYSEQVVYAVRGPMAHGLMIQCDAASPPTEQDLEDFEAFFGSVTSDPY